MPNIDEITPYYGQYTGYQIDTAIGRALNPEMDVINVTSLSDQTLASAAAVDLTMVDEFLVVRILNMTVSGAFSKTYTQRSDSYQKKGHISADHYVVAAEFSNPSVMGSDLGWTTGAEQITLTGTGSGTTNITLYLAKCTYPIDTDAV